MRNLCRMRAASRSSSRASRASASSACTRSRFCSHERRATRRIARVEHGAVGQDDAHAGQRVIAVLRRPAAHSAGVVGGDAADHRGVDRCGVGPILRPKGASARFAVAPITPGCKRDRGAVVADLALPPVVPQQDQHRVGDRLARQAGAGGTERDRRIEFRAHGEQLDRLLLALHHDHELGHQPIEARVGPPGQQT